MATAKKLDSGSWRCLAFIGMENGKRKYKSFTAPTKKQAEFLAAEYLMNKEDQTGFEDMTFNEALELYIDTKTNVLSESTIAGYKNIQRNRIKDIKDIPLKDITKATAQGWVNKLSKDSSVKTVKNAYGLFSAVMLMYMDKRFNVQFQQKKAEEVYIPSDDDIKTILKRSEGDLQTALYLGAFAGLRRGEICALERSDVCDGYLVVNKSMGLTLDREWKIKPPKTESSNRMVNIPDFLVKMLRQKEGRLVDLNPDQVTNQFCRLRDSLGLPSFRFHDLRHYYVSINHALGVPDQYIMQMGGWSTDNTMKTVYRNTLKPERDKFAALSVSHFEKMQHEMQHKKRKCSK